MPDVVFYRPNTFYYSRGLALPGESTGAASIDPFKSIDGL